MPGHFGQLLERLRDDLGWEVEEIGETIDEAACVAVIRKAETSDQKNNEKFNIDALGFQVRIVIEYSQGHYLSCGDAKGY